MNKKEAKIKKGFWKKFYDLLSPSKKEIKIALILLLLNELLQLVGPYLLKLIIDNLIQFSVEKISLILFFIVLFFIGEQTSSLVYQIVINKKACKILFDAEYYLFAKAYSKIISLPLGYHEKENTGNKITKISRGVDKIVYLLDNTLFEVAPVFLQFCATLLILFFIDWRFGIVFFTFSPLFVWMTYVANKNLRPMRKSRYKKYEEASGKMAESIININAVKSFAREDSEVKKVDSIRQKIKNIGIQEFLKLFFYNLKRNFVIDTGRVCVFLLGVYLVWNDSITVGTLVFVITLSEKSNLSLYRLGRFYDRIQEGMEGVNRLMGLFEQKSNIINPQDGLKPKSMEGRVRFENVSFHYEDKKEKALDRINLKINSGCFTALIGPSGGGKTTLIKMIYRHYDPQRGDIFLDNKKLKDYDIKSFRRFMAIVPQEVEIFNTSIKDNISYANPGADFREVQAAAKIANAEEFIEKLPKKYDTLVGERGIKLSGGQRQRIGIARAILANPRILIFDEATSNLDSYSEKLIQESIDKIREGRTLIVIAHRLSTIKKADKIIVIEKGRVVEEGGHRELARVNGGLYAKLLKLQSMGDIE